MIISFTASVLMFVVFLYVVTKATLRFLSNRNMLESKPLMTGNAVIEELKSDPNIGEDDKDEGFEVFGNKAFFSLNIKNQ